MAVRDNTYRDLQRIAGSLARAMIGSAQDDANIALGRYRDAQTEGQNLSNQSTRDLQNAVETASDSPILTQTLLNSLGAQRNEAGALIKQPLPGGDQMSMPMFPNQTSMTTAEQNKGVNSLARSLFGDLTYNPDQLASALNTLSGAGASRMAESMILSGAPDAAQRGALLLDPSGGQFQNPGFAMTQLQTQDATNRRDDDLNFESRMDSNEKVLKASKFKTTEQEKTKQSKPIILGQNQVAFDAEGNRIGNAAGPTSPEKPIILKKGDTAFNVDGTEIASVEGGPAIIKLTEGQVAMIEDPEAEGGYREVRGSNDKQPKSIVASPGQTVVTIDNDGEVISTKTVNDDPITVKANEGQTVQLVVDDPQNPGQKKTIYTLKGQPKASSTTSTDTGFTLSANDDSALRDAFDKALVNNNFDLPDVVLRSLRDVLVEQSLANMGSKKNITRGVNYISTQLRKGFTEVTIPNTGSIASFGQDTKIQVPNFVLKKLRDKMFGDRDEAERADFDYQEKFASLKDKSKQQIRGNFTSLGYSDAEINAIIGVL